MQGKGNPPDLEIVCLLEFFNTPGNEVAPGSDVIGKDFQKDPASFGHLFSPHDYKNDYRLSCGRV